ncbi:MAG: hypothetical protein V7719_16895 [Psychroserpens sp.]|uniref:hypothetical protein n=1 Tax=Psychroserpens sp. TaxID=2020870 RepID=UPI0030039238
MRNAFDIFLIEEILPSIRKALFREDKLIKKQFNRSIHSKFYEDDTKGISSYILTERTLQYIIFKELCLNFKVLPEDSAYFNTKERLDLSIYKNIKDPDKFAEIGIEIKQVRYNRNGGLHKRSVKGIENDFDKIKRAGNKNKYILLFGVHDQKHINIDFLNSFLKSEIDNRKFKKYHLEVIAQDYFKTEVNNQKKNYIINLIKLI